MTDADDAGIRLPEEQKSNYKLLMREWQFQRKKPDATEAEFLQYLMDLYQHDKKTR